MFGGVTNTTAFGFQPNATVSTIKAGTQGNVHHFDGAINCSLDDECEIRPSQLDEFVEVRTQIHADIPQTVPEVYANQSGVMGGGPSHITSSYITIGDDDPFITGKFCDASTKQFNFRPQSHNPSKINPSIPMSKNSDMMQYYQNPAAAKKY